MRVAIIGVLLSLARVRGCELIQRNPFHRSTNDGSEPLHQTQHAPGLSLLKVSTPGRGVGRTVRLRSVNRLRGSCRYRRAQGVALRRPPSRRDSTMTAAQVEKIDLKKELKHLYQASAKEVVQIDVPAFTFLMVDSSQPWASHSLSS